MTASGLFARHFFAMGAMAGATLYCQVALTRLFSAVQYYHGAFLTVSVALFGFAVSGVYVFLRPEAFTRQRLDAAVARHALLFAAAVPTCFYFYLYVGVGPAVAALGLATPGVVESALEYLLLATPFFASGTCISLLLRHGSSQANRLYATDLAASGAGAVAVVPALAFLGGPKSMLVASALAGCVALSMRPGRRPVRGLAAGVVTVVLVIAILVPADAFNGFKLRKPPMIVATDAIRWNSFSMVGVGPERQTYIPSPTGGAVLQRERDIIIDNSVSTVMLQSDGDLAKLSFLERDWNSGAHVLRKDADVLIIGAGGGRDIQAARIFEQREIWALEVNPLVQQTANELFGDYTGRVYSAPNVHSVVGDARSFVANSDRRFDIILASLIDTWAASAAGAFALTENLLYTQDAFLDYYEHLSQDGILSISRWHPIETARLLATGLDAWQSAGAEFPRRHAVMLLSREILGSRIVVLLMKKSPYTAEELGKLEQFSVDSGLQVILTPQAIRSPLLAQYLRARSRNTTPWPGLDVEPATDDRPFFFNSVRPSVQIREILGLGQERQHLEGFQSNLTATRTLIQLLFAVTALVGLMILLPLGLRGAALAGPHLVSLLGYFTCLGLGYILIEIGLIQRLILLLGKPVYSLAVILSTMLLVSGLGSFASDRLSQRQIATRLPIILIAASAVLSAYTWGLPFLIRGLLGTPFPIRLGSAVGCVAAPAFLLGMPFPSGLRALGARYDGRLIPWVWGVNGSMSVLASVGAITLAIEYGYTVVFLLGAACYLAAALFLKRWAG